MFGLVYIAVTSAIWLQTRSLASLVALPALVATVALFWLDAAHSGAYASAVWALAGAWLIFQGLRNGDTPKNSEVLAGALYGISGIVYVLFYLGFQNETLSAVPVISDVAFGLGLFVGTWPGVIANRRHRGGRGFRRGDMEIAREDLARGALRDRSEG